MASSDRRIRYTKQAIKDSLFELMQETPVEKITVKQLCAAADINRATFYAHYDTLTALLEDYFRVIDPLSVNRQGHDQGIQYRTGIYYTDPAQLPEIEAVYRAQEAKAGRKLAVELLPLQNFFTAEEYHQKYLDKNPGGYCHIPDRMLHLAEAEGR